MTGRLSDRKVFKVPNLTRQVSTAIREIAAVASALAAQGQAKLVLRV